VPNWAVGMLSLTGIGTVFCSKSGFFWATFPFLQGVVVWNRHTPSHKNKPTCISLLYYGLNRKCKCFALAPQLVNPGNL
jgi:hypothetical protein